MGNPKTIHKQKAFLSPINKDLKNRRSAIYFYWNDYMGKLLKVPDFINVNKRVK